MIRIVVLICLLLTLSRPAYSANAQGYAVAAHPTPVFNTPDLYAIFPQKSGGRIKTDRCGQIRELEFVALPGTAFTIRGETRNAAATILRVSTKDYPDLPGTSYYIDSRFVRRVEDKPPEREKKAPDRETILARLTSAVGTPYLWGGNVRLGIREMAIWYPAGTAGNLPAKAGGLSRLAGLDCSGLLYEATGGFTPRNTSDLVRFGEPLPIQGGAIDSIVNNLLPLDLIVWPGHILIVVDRERVIESRLNCDGTKDGVVISPLRSRVAEVMRSRKPVDRISSDTGKSKGEFVVRRWFQ